MEQGTFGLNFLLARVKCLLHEELKHVTNLLALLIIINFDMLSQMKEQFAVGRRGAMLLTKEEVF